MGDVTQKFQFKIPCKSEAISDFLENVFTILERENHGIENLNFRFELAAREMLANAIEHGCLEALENGFSRKEIEILVVLKIKKEEIVFSVKDCGKGFEWTNYDFDEMPNLEERGRGLKMVNNVVDRIEFNNSGNKITVYFC